MKVTINETEKEDLEFPKLMIARNTNFIILAVDKSDKDFIGGVVISESEYYPVGYIYHSWNIYDFQDFKGSITLENE